MTILISIGLVDPERMGISGSSYGGYMTSWTISQTNRFKAAVVGAAITDVPSFIRTTDVPDRFEDYLGEDPKNYLRGSPMNYAENIRTPALIWHGDGRYPRTADAGAASLYGAQALRRAHRVRDLSRRSTRVARPRPPAGFTGEKVALADEVGLGRRRQSRADRHSG